MVIRHLTNHSVYSLSGEWPDLIPGDGIELLTGYSPVPEHCFGDTVSVHLPYSTDWYSVWTGRLEVPEDTPDDTARFIFYGRDREGIVDSLRTSMEIAAPLRPAYAVLHAGSANLNELLAQSYSDSDDDVLDAFAEAVNRAVSDFPGGEPPFRILFENQWWPGLRMLDGRNYRRLCDRIEFENWGLCLDTGHLLVTTQGSKDECQAVEMLLGIFDRYPKDMIDSIMTVHLHVNTSAGYISNYHVPDGYYDMSLDDRLTEGYRFVCGMDRHLPFTVRGASDLIDRLDPDYVTHEMGAVSREDFARDYRTQRSLFM